LKIKYTVLKLGWSVNSR